MSLRLAIAATLLAACAGASHPQARNTPQPAPEASAAIVAAQDIGKLQARWRAALVTKDTVFFAQTLTDDFMLTGDSSIASKAEYIHGLAADSGAVPASRVTENLVRVYGEVAVATGLIEYAIPVRPEPLLVRYTEVWLKQEGRWRAVHGHYNPLLSSGQREIR